MRLGYIVFIVCSCMIHRQLAYNCTACDKQTCPPKPSNCWGRYAIDPCGCCEHCVKKAWEPCGGENWKHGYCDRGLKCANITGEVLVEIPHVGTCKSMRHYRDPSAYFEDDDDLCPARSGCFRVMGTCDCVTKRTCFLEFTMSREDCYKPDYPDHDNDNMDAFLEHYHTTCYKQGCDIIDQNCVCQSKKCTEKFQYADAYQCNDALVKQICVNVTCPDVGKLTCPHDSAASKPFTPLGACCPTVPSYCTCDFDRCNNKCPKRRRKVMVKETDGIPGNCCDRFLCLL